MKKVRNINYLNRDFTGFKQSLEEYTKAYFPETYTDFSETSTGMLFMEMASYIGDVLSFYIDNQIQENFIQYSRQLPNLYNMAYMLGYTPKVTTASTTYVDFYQLLPSKKKGGETVPDFDYCLTIPENTEIKPENNDNNFIIESSVDFAHSSSIDPTEITVYQIHDDEPLYYLLKKSRKATSSSINTVEFTFGTPKKFDSRTINASNIIGVLEVTDSEGNEWFEVPNLSQDTILKQVKNENLKNSKNPNISGEAPMLLKMKNTSKRFVTRFQNKNVLKIEFGAGSIPTQDELIIPNPDNVGKGLPFKRTQMTTAYSPVNFMFTNSYGEAPSNTTLTVKYLTGGGINSNVEANTLNIIDTSKVKFNHPNIQDSGLADKIFESLGVNNPRAAEGGSNGDSIEELKQNILGNFQSQLRTVTAEDYKIRALSMPSTLGSISKAYIKPTEVSEIEKEYTNSTLDLYILTYDINKKLQYPSRSIKENLKTYLYEYKMINDKINIKDAYIVNIGVEFDLITLPNYNNNEILSECINVVEELFNIDKWQINEPIMLRDLYIALDKVEGVQTVQDVRILNKTGESLGYSRYSYDIEGATINNVVYPSVDPMIFEIKYPDNDIKGRIVTL